MGIAKSLMQRFSFVVKEKNEHAFLLALVLFLSIFFAGINYRWLIKEASPPAWDQAYYLLCSERFYQALNDKGIVGLVESISNTNNERSPLISLLPLPFYYVLGEGEHSAMFVNFTFLLLLSYYLFKLVAHLYNPRAAFISVLVVQTMPFIYFLNRTFFIEYGLASLTVVYLYYLVKSNLFEDMRCNCLLGFLFGMGLLLKISFPLYIVFPTLWTIYLRHKNRGDICTPVFFSQIVGACFIAILVAIFWYTPKHLMQSFEYLWWNSFGSIDTYYRSSFVGFEYASRIIFKVFSLYYFLILIFFLVLTIFLYSLKKWGMTQQFKENVLFLLCWILPVFICAFSQNKDPRFVVPIIIPLGVMTGVLIDIVWSSLPNFRKLPWFMGILLLLFYPSFNGMINEPFYDPIDSSDKTNWKLNEVINYMHQEIHEERAGGSHFIINLTDGPVINENTFNYYISLNHYKDPIEFTRWGPFEKDINKAVYRIEEAKPAFLLWAEGHWSIMWGQNYLAMDLHKMLLNGRFPYVRDREFHLTNGVTLILYKRRP